MEASATLVLEAAAVLTGVGGVYSPGAVAVQDGSIVAVGELSRVAVRGAERRTYPNAVIIPGLVNAHSHLDLSFLSKPLSFNGSFTRWLLKVGWARSQTSDEKCESAARRALESLAASGVTTVGDITTIEGGFRALRDSGLRGVAYFETFGFKQERVEGERDRLNFLLDRCSPTEKVLVGISPHTPYTVGPRLWELLKREFKARVDRFSVHVSEILEEAAFLEGGWGPFRHFLRMAGLLDKEWRPPGMSPVEYVDSFGFVTRGTSLVHGNFLTDGDRRLLAGRQGKGAVCIVHCPRAHRFFQRLPFPLAELLPEGIPVALGTDSLASNSSLDMLEEMKTVHIDHPELPVQEIVRMATLRGAEALRLENITGSLEEGKRADLAMIDVSGTSTAMSPEERILAASSRCTLTMVAGETIFSED